MCSKFVRLDMFIAVLCVSSKGAREVINYREDGVSSEGVERDTYIGDTVASSRDAGKGIGSFEEIVYLSSDVVRGVTNIVTEHAC